MDLRILAGAAPGDRGLDSAMEMREAFAGLGIEVDLRRARAVGGGVEHVADRAGARRTWHGECADKEGDDKVPYANTYSLGALLYFALTGRWPGKATGSLSPAPTEEGRLCSPRQVRAGVPRDLDHTEAGRLAGCTPETFTVRLSRARKKLRIALARDIRQLQATHGWHLNIGEQQIKMLLATQHALSCARVACGHNLITTMLQSTCADIAHV